jgi:hypothetical protein
MKLFGTPGHMNVVCMQIPLELASTSLFHNLYFHMNSRFENGKVKE